jgi:signal transduction histidine kinase
MRRRYRDLPIHAKILVPFAILVIVWGGFGAAILAHGTASEARARATAQLAAAFDGARTLLADDERSLLETERLAANTQGVDASLAKRDARGLLQLLEPVALNAGHDRLLVVDPVGRVLLAFDTATKRTLALPPLTTDAVLRAARGATDQQGDKWAAVTGSDLLVAGPVVGGDGRADGAVVISDDLAGIAGRMGRGTGARVVLFAPNGTPLTSNGGPLPFHQATSTGLHVSVRVDGQAMETLYGPMDVRGERAGVLAVALPANVVLAGVAGKTMWLAVLVGAAVLVALMIGMMTARAITGPVARLVEATRALQGGRLEVRAPDASGDEIGTLAASFNAMATELEASHRELERKVDERTGQLTKANAELARVSSAKSAFLATLSHELRTPLNGIIGFADMLADPTFGAHDDADTRELAANILTSGRHLLRLINDLLDLAKIEAGKLDIAVEPVAVASVVEEVETALRPLARDKRLALTTEVDERLPRVVADPARLRQVLFNLVANAIKFTPHGGLVAVDAKAEDGRVTISVADTGPGMKPDEIARVFEPYERGEAGREEEGAGLGLALSKLLIEAHEGRIWVESVYGRGSTFFVTIPIVDREPTEARR